MTRTAALRVDLSKEIRALLPVWAACVAAVAGAAVSREGGILLKAGIAAYIVGPMAIGAHAIGHEYGYRTLPMLLSQPVDRRRMHVLKFVVVASMVLTLAAFASKVLMNDAVAQGMWRHVSVQVLPVLGGLFVAPWLTMICRSSLAGILLTGSVGAVTFLGLMVLTALWLGIDVDAAHAMSIGPWSSGMMAFCAVAGVLGVRRFTRLEAIEDALPALHLPRWVKSVERVRVHRPLRAVAAKELRLQQLTFVVAGLYIIGTVVLSLLQRMIPAWSDFPTAAVMLLYCIILSIVIGALASAEERQHGTLEWQLLQPAPAWRQWMVKVSVTVGLALLFGAGLPWLLFQITPTRGIQPIRLSYDLPIVIVLLTAGGIYISSLSSSGVRAMVLSLPVGIGVALFIQTVNRLFPLPAWVDPASRLMFLLRAFSVGMMPLLLWFAFVNHTSSVRPPGRIAGQGASIALVLVIGMALVAVAGRF